MPYSQSILISYISAIFCLKLEFLVFPNSFRGSEFHYTHSRTSFISAYFRKTLHHERYGDLNPNTTTAAAVGDLLELCHQIFKALSPRNSIYIPIPSGGVDQVRAECFDMRKYFVTTHAHGRVGSPINVDEVQVLQACCCAILCGCVCALLDSDKSIKSCNCFWSGISGLWFRWFSRDGELSDF